MLYFDVIIPLKNEAQFFPSLSIQETICFSIGTEAYSGLSQISKMELFVNIRIYLKPLTSFSDSSILVVFLDCNMPLRYASLP